MDEQNNFGGQADGIPQDAPYQPPQPEDLPAPEPFAQPDENTAADGVGIFAGSFETEEEPETSILIPNEPQTFAQPDGPQYQPLQQAQYQPPQQAQYQPPRQAQYQPPQQPQYQPPQQAQYQPPQQPQYQPPQQAQYQPPQQAQYRAPQPQYQQPRQQYQPQQPAYSRPAAAASESKRSFPFAPLIIMCVGFIGYLIVNLRHIGRDIDFLAECARRGGKSGIMSILNYISAPLLICLFAIFMIVYLSAFYRGFKSGVMGGLSLLFLALSNLIVCGLAVYQLIDYFEGMGKFGRVTDFAVYYIVLSAVSFIVFLFMTIASAKLFAQRGKGMLITASVFLLIGFTALTVMDFIALEPAFETYYVLSLASLFLMYLGVLVFSAMFRPRKTA